MEHAEKSLEPTLPKKSFSRRRLPYILAAAVCLIVIIVTITLANVLSDAKMRAKTALYGPVVYSNFADPCVIEVDKKYYAFATNSIVAGGGVHIQLATSDDFKNWTLTGKDALPFVGEWSAGVKVWAPSVVQLDDASFVMYYAARNNATGPFTQCIGAATSKTIEGPYTPLPSPIVCPLSQGGAIDPDGFRDVDGSRYIVYKIDGNNLNNRTRPVHPTPLMLQQVDSKDGVTLIGEPLQLLDRDETDGPLIEGPSLMRVAGSGKAGEVYILFFSSNSYTTSHYDVAYAASTTGIKGPYTRAATPLLSTGDDGGKLYGPGGIDVLAGSRKVVFNADMDSNWMVRQMWTGQIAVDGTTVRI